MQFGIDLITESTLTIVPGNKFRLILYKGDEIIPASLGEDTYNFNCHILPNKTVAATGREFTHDIETGLGPVEAESAAIFDISQELLNDLRLVITNNRILDQADLKWGFSLRIYLNRGIKDLLLARPDIKVYWDGRGQFSIPLGPHLA